jgi:hypothetical protein
MPDPLVIFGATVPCVVGAAFYLGLFPRRDRGLLVYARNTTVGGKIQLEFGFDCFLLLMVIFGKLLIISSWCKRMSWSH